MSFDLPAELENRVAHYAEEANVTPDEAVAHLVQKGLRQTEREKGGGWALLGLFSSPEDVALMEEVDAIIAEGRREDASREIEW